MTENTKNLPGMRENERGTVIGMRATDDIRVRLVDLGLTEGSSVTCLHKSALGGITAYYISGAVIALRDCDCAGVTVGC